MDNNRRKQQYLANFKRQNPVPDLFGTNAQRIGNSIVEKLKKEELTYDEAYASLQYAYNKIKFESNFLKI